jgi:predicted DNA-binding transcriptional regulator AlpA
VNNETLKSGSAKVPAVPKNSLSISKWVNEMYPPWAEILSAHHVARLTRRHRWVLNALEVLGRFPRKLHFQGRPIGWHRCDVARWLDGRCHIVNHSATSEEGSTLLLPFPFRRDYVTCAAHSRLPAKPACRRRGNALTVSRDIDGAKLTTGSRRRRSRP